jgi:hypothetical protein
VLIQISKEAPIIGRQQFKERHFFSPCKIFLCLSNGYELKCVKVRYYKSAKNFPNNYKEINQTNSGLPCPGSQGSHARVILLWLILNRLDDYNRQDGRKLWA